jgi:hypothetical protein
VYGEKSWASGRRQGPFNHWIPAFESIVFMVGVHCSMCAYRCCRAGWQSKTLSQLHGLTNTPETRRVRSSAGWCSDARAVHFTVRVGGPPARSLGIALDCNRMVHVLYRVDPVSNLTSCKVSTHLEKVARARLFDVDRLAHISFARCGSALSCVPAIRSTLCECIPNGGVMWHAGEVANASQNSAQCPAKLRCPSWHAVRAPIAVSYHISPGRTGSLKSASVILTSWSFNN